MHIEPGVLVAAKVAGANVAALALVAAAAWLALRRPAQLLRALLAALFFTLCMQAFHLRVGPSELHFVGAMPMYLALGLVPTVLGFALGLLLQGLLFEPADLVHLAVNTLSLALPLLALHATLGRRLQRVSLRAVLKLDAAYYAGVTVMVGFWLSLGEVATPLADWLRFAASYLAVVAIEPAITVAVLLGVARLRARRWVAWCFDLRHAMALR
ncbi:MAG: energy-coupling factor ABC transporter permease [Ideonella sp.]|nr:energy-coupling factor ABC transporter permease [Ideonella sp.]MCC7458237.1 energy-coupling factor ABC transporter permease [Nitrospira sp.]